MLKLTQADYGSQTEGDPIYVNPSAVWHMIPHRAGSYVHCGSVMHGHGWWVKETADEVDRLIEVQRMQQASKDHWLHELAVAYDAPALSKDQRRVMGNLMSRIQAKLEDTPSC